MQIFEVRVIFTQVAGGSIVVEAENELAALEYAKATHDWHKDEDGRILILEWDENMEWGMETGSDIMWTYEGWGQELADGWWWPEEIIFNVED